MRKSPREKVGFECIYVYEFCCFVLVLLPFSKCLRLMIYIEKSDSSRVRDASRALRWKKIHCLSRFCFVEK